MEEQGRRVWKAAHVGSPQTLDVWWYQINVEPPLKFPPSANSFSLEWNVNLQPSAHHTRLLLQNQEQHHQPNGLPNFQNIPPSIHVLIKKKETFFAIKKSVGNFKSSCNVSRVRILLREIICLLVCLLLNFWLWILSSKGRGEWFWSLLILWVYQ